MHFILKSPSKSKICGDVYKAWNVMFGFSAGINYHNFTWNPCSYITAYTPAETVRHWSCLTTHLLMWIADTAGE